MLSCGLVPHTKGSGITPAQETLFIGGIGLGKMYQTLDQALAQDDGQDFEAEAILNNIDPVVETRELADTKTYVRAEFPTVNPYDAGVTLYMSANVNDPHKSPTNWEALTHKAGSIRAYLNNKKARFINLRIRKTTAIPATRPVFSSFVLWFVRNFGRPGARS